MSKYFPYFRGKQYELIAVRENAAMLASAGFIPVIEPVKEALGGLEKALDAICNVGGQVVVVVNPLYGDHSEDGESISTLLKDKYRMKPAVTAGILLNEAITIKQIVDLCEEHKDHGLTLVHAGFTDAKILAEKLGEKCKTIRHIFFEQYCGLLYRKYFAGAERILIRDGFEKRLRNKDHPPLEPFSDLHVTYEEVGMNGFGDFLTVGDGYSVGGGPAYVIAIHLTFIDDEKDHAMFLYHFKSIRMDTPTDPAGKFAEALQAMIEKLNEPGSKVFNSKAIAEFRTLHAKGHFPGLGYVKKLSMQHHIETMANFFE